MNAVFLAVAIVAGFFLASRRTPALNAHNQYEVSRSKKDDDEAEEEEVEKPKFDPYIA